MLTAPLPSLDSFFAVVTSTPPIPSFSFSANGFNSFSHSQRVDPSTGLYTSDPLLSDPQGSCSVKEDVWFGAQSTSPSSPFTYVSSIPFWHAHHLLTSPSIDSQTDSQAGGDYIPPASESNPSDSPSAEHNRRAFPNLNISLPPSGFQLGAGFSPVSLVSSGAAFTDSLSMNVDPAEDYFRFSDAALPPGQGDDPILTSVSLPQSARPTPSPLGNGPMIGGMPQTSGHYRLPASQPSSPVRGVFMSGQQQFTLSPAGRQRSTTVSGMSPYDPAFAMAGFGPPLQIPPLGGAVTAPVTAVPAHLAFTAFHSPAATPLVQSPSVVASVAASPATERPPNAFLGSEANNTAAQAGTSGDVTMEDATNPSSRRSSGGSPQSTTGLSGGGGSAAQAVASATASAVAAAAASQAQSTNDMAERLTMERLTMLDK